MLTVYLLVLYARLQSNISNLIQCYFILSHSHLLLLFKRLIKYPSSYLGSQGLRKIIEEKLFSGNTQSGGGYAVVT